MRIGNNISEREGVLGKRERENTSLFRNTQMKNTKRGDRNGTLWVHSPDQLICVYTNSVER